MPEKSHLDRQSAPKDRTYRNTPSEEKEIREAALDQTIEETFPASDPLSTLPNPDNEQAFERR